MLPFFIACGLAVPSQTATPPRPLFYRPHASPRVADALSRRLATLPASKTVAVWVFFTDKAVATPMEYEKRLTARRAALSAESLRRRVLRRTSPGLLDERDLDLTAEYVAAVRASGVRVRRTSRWLNAVSVDATRAQAATLARLPFVQQLAPVAALRGPRPEPVQPAAANTMTPMAFEPAWYGTTYAQLNQIGVVAAHQAGYTGTGVIIGILDTGFRRTHDVYNQSNPSATPPVHPIQVLSEWDYVNNDGNTGIDPGDPGGQMLHGSETLGIMAGFDPTVYVGAAFDASYRLAKTENTTSERPVEEDNFAAALEDFEALGIDVATSSLGYFTFDAPYTSYTYADLNGHTAITTIAVNNATDNGVICCTAAGNATHDTNPATLHLVAPADAYKVLTCGAVDSANNISGFSSDGPSYDGRVKPELLARGSSTAIINPNFDNQLTASNGTSFSTPLVAGGVALIVQAHPNWSVDRMRRALLHTAGDFVANGTYDATYVRGYGLVNIMAAIQFVEGDINGDGRADGDDIAPFVAALVGSNGNAAQRRNADLNASGAVDANDVPIFVNDLLAN